MLITSHIGKRTSRYQRWERRYTYGIFPTLSQYSLDRPCNQRDPVPDPEEKKGESDGKRIEWNEMDENKQMEMRRQDKKMGGEEKEIRSE